METLNQLLDLKEPGVMDYVHLQGVYFIHNIQALFKHYGDLMQFITTVGDPRYAFLIYFPLSYCLHRHTGIQVIWLACISEWLNAVLKWILHGERPYWWIHERQQHDHLMHPVSLEQYSLTCETGPGSPSGHAMITAAVMYVMMRSFNKHALPSNRNDLKFMIWCLYGMLLFAVNISRLFIATHFPHQVVAGTIAGMLLGEVIKHEHVSKLALRHYLGWCTLLLILVAVTYFTILIIGLDPFWSIAKAVKWCANRDWVHPDTSLFFSIDRDISTLSGFGVSLYLAKRLNVDSEFRNPMVRCLQIILSIAVTLTMESYKIPHQNELIFYIGGFIKFFSMVNIVVVVIPYCLKIFFEPVERIKKS